MQVQLLKYVSLLKESTNNNPWIRFFRRNIHAGHERDPQELQDRFKATLRSRQVYSDNNRSLLIVDDEPGVVRALERQLRHEKYTIYTAYSGESGLDILQEYDIGVVLSDYLMPGMDGITFLELVKQKKPHVVRMLFTGHSSVQNAMNAINRSRIFGYITKPWSPDSIKQTIEKAFQHYNLLLENMRLQNLTEEQNRQLNRINEDLETSIRKRTSQLEEAIREGILMLAMAAEAKDDDTGKHLLRIHSMTRNICLGLGLSPEDSEQISFFSIMHDVGKIHIPDEILQKRGPLTNGERAVMRTHCVAGEKILGNKPFYQIAREIARNHHERWDGKGYPDGLTKDSIPLSARIVSVADIFDALTHKRPYKEAWPVEKAVREMKALSGKAFDPDILNAFLKLQEKDLDLNNEIMESFNESKIYPYHFISGR